MVPALPAATAILVRDRPVLAVSMVRRLIPPDARSGDVPTPKL